MSGARPIGERMLSVQGMTDLTHAERTFVSVLAYHDGPKGCYPAISTVAKIIGVSLTRAKELLKSVKDKGRVQVKQRRRQTGIFTIHYDAPLLEVLETCTSRIELRSAENLTTNRKDQEAPTVKEPQQRERSMTIGWCKECGHDRVVGDDGCAACGVEDRPFIVPEHEQRLGVITLPFGITVEGLDSMEARRLFLSAEGQAALHEAYREILGEAVVH